ncbi:LytTR family DNA-binding domain-containing protein [Gramella sp. KN1008]|uniref:LytR/AlgR family response regulator transcription factor n=1 Tax=Gramella sp. KN1008 TaxID=2529298 RepID=UPI00103EB489|nr:LytTR family DNA-binding domain-containing protein [Gramella sp. KN1008]TBW25874.1 response regulator transcription factor [Gramella sp. KN1008]
MRILIVDDEILARNRIKKLLESRNDIEEIEESESGESAIDKIQKLTPDLIFLDISLKDMTGFDVLSNLKDKKKPIIIFVTAYDNYALKAFNFQAFDFLLKPFKEERFHKSVNQAKELNQMQIQHHLDKRIRDLINLTNHENNTPVKKLPVKVGNKTIFINSAEIKYIKADRYYAEIFTEENSKHVIRQSLNSLMESLDNEKFCRIHRSTIINKEFILEVIHSDYSEIDIKMKDGQLFRVSRSQKKEVLQSLGI